MKSRRAAQEADIVVINHHLLFADLMVKEGGFGEVIPRFEVLVCDEAHLYLPTRQDSDWR